MRSEKYRRSQNVDNKGSQTGDYWEETQVLFQSRDQLKEEVEQQRAYEERRARAAAYKEYLELRESAERAKQEGEGRSSRSSRAASRSQRYNDEKIKKKSPILSENKDRDEAREERREEKRRQKEAAKAKFKPSELKEKMPKKKSDGGSGGRKLTGGKRKAVLVLLVIAVVLFGIMLMITGMMGKVGKLDINKDNLGIDKQVSKDLKKYRNVVLLGVDARDMEDFNNCRTDAMIILSIDKKNKEIRQISVYRDTYVHVNDEYGYDKITNIHAYAGTEATIHALNENMDLNIEDVIIVNWKAVADGIDALGGVEIEVLDSELYELNKYINETARSIGGEPVKLESAGKQTLNGVQAVTYSRIRKDAATGDYRRNERMKIVVSAAVDQAKKHPLKVSKAASVALPQIKTNMGTGDLLKVAKSFVFSDMTGSTGWPFDTSGWTAPNGAWCGVPVTLDRNVAQLHEEYFGQEGYVSTQTVQDISAEISARTGYY